MKFAAMGRTEYLYDTILALRAAGHEPGCIVTAAAAPEYSRKEGDFESLAAKCGCAFILGAPSQRTEELKILRGCDIAVSVNWPFVLGKGILELFPHGVLNVHAGDLPRYRGNACPNWAIIQGEEEVWLSVHRMVPSELDCGPILSQRRLPLTSETYIAEVNAWILRTAPEMFLEALNRLERDPAYCVKVARAADPEALRCYPRVPEDGWIDWERDAGTIHRLVRASAPPLPGAYTYCWNGGVLEKVHVLRAAVAPEGLGRDLAVPGQILRNEQDTGRTFVACGEKTVLSLEECRIDSVAFAPGKEWRSIRTRLGVRAEDILWRLLSEQGQAR